MKRWTLQAFALFAAPLGLAGSVAARAETSPSHAVTIVVPFVPGGTTIVTAWDG